VFLVNKRKSTGSMAIDTSIAGSFAQYSSAAARVSHRMPVISPPWARSGFSRWELMSVGSSVGGSHHGAARGARSGSNVSEDTQYSGISSKHSMTFLVGAPSASVYVPLKLAVSQASPQGIHAHRRLLPPPGAGGSDTDSSGGRVPGPFVSFGPEPSMVSDVFPPRIPEAGELEEAAELAETQKEGRKGPGFRESLATLVMNPLYVWTVFSLCALYFVVTGIQFWTTEFLIAIYEVPRHVVVGAFAGTAATAPTLGVVLGGVSIDCVGGYRTKAGTIRTLFACCIYGLIATACGVTAGWLPVDKKLWVLVLALIWVLLFFGGAILPPATGMLINTVPLNMRFYASGISMCTYNILGYSAGAALPGALMTALGGLREGMKVIFAWSFFGLMGMAVAVFFACRDTDDQETLNRQESSDELGANKVAQAPPTTQSVPSSSRESSPSSRGHLAGTTGFEGLDQGSGQAANAGAMRTHLLPPNNSP